MFSLGKLRHVYYTTPLCVEGLSGKPVSRDDNKTTH